MKFAVFLLVIHTALVFWGVAGGFLNYAFLQAAKKVEADWWIPKLEWVDRLVTYLVLYSVLFVFTFGPLYAVQAVWPW